MKDSQHNLNTTIGDDVETRFKVGDKLINEYAPHEGPLTVTEILEDGSFTYEYDHPVSFHPLLHEVAGGHAYTMSNYRLANDYKVVNETAE